MVLFLIGIDRISAVLAWSLIAVSAIAALGHLLIKGRYLPRFVMDILDRLSDKAQLEQSFTARSMRLSVIDAEQLARRIKARVVGQDGIIDRLTVQIRRRMAAQRADKPIAVFCFAGPPAVGKTHLAKVLAEELYSDRNHLHFFDMSQFGQPHAAASLFGQARGYVGSQSYGSLPVFNPLGVKVAAHVPPDGAVTNLAIADLNGDGHPDVLLTVQEDSGVHPVSVVVLLNNGRGGFSDQTQSVFSGPVPQPEAPSSATISRVSPP